MDCCTPKMSSIAVHGEEWQTKQFEQFVSEIWADIQDADFSAFVKTVRASGSRPDMPQDYRPKDAADYLDLLKRWDERDDNPYQFK